MGLARRRRVGICRPAWWPDRPPAHAVEMGAVGGRDGLVCWRGVQHLAAGLGEPDPLRAAVNQAATDERESGGATDRPVGDHRRVGVGELLQRGPFCDGQLQTRTAAGRLGRRRLGHGARGAPGTQGAGLDLGPGPAPAWGRPMWGHGRPQATNGLLINGHENWSTSNCGRARLLTSTHAASISRSIMCICTATCKSRIERSRFCRQRNYSLPASSLSSPARTKRISSSKLAASRKAPKTLP